VHRNERKNSWETRKRDSFDGRWGEGKKREEGGVGAFILQRGSGSLSGRGPSGATRKMKDPKPARRNALSSLTKYAKGFWKEPSNGLAIGGRALRKKVIEAL